MLRDNTVVKITEASVTAFIEDLSSHTISSFCRLEMS